MRLAQRIFLAGYILFAILGIQLPCGAVSVNVSSGNWSLLVDDSDLQGGAGSNMKPSYESTGSPSYVTVYGTSGLSDNWRIDVKRIDSVWDPNLTLSVKRTTDGTGLGPIAGGDSYMQIGPTDSAFFSGSGDRNNIPLEMELGGMSLQVPPSTYSTTIVYTVVEL